MREVTIRPAGDSAVLVELGDRIDLALNRQVHAAAQAVRQALANYGPVEVIPGYAGFLVDYNPAALTYLAVRRIIVETNPEQAAPPSRARRFTLPTVYGGEFGPDLADLSRSLQIAPGDVIRTHAGRDYPIYCLGFSAGFPLLGGLPAALHTPRLETPRPRVPAGSVAIGGSQTGVYPRATPGGWHLIGRTPLRLFDIAQTPPIPYGPGDVIRFVGIDPEEYSRLEGSSQMPVGEEIEAPETGS